MPRKTGVPPRISGSRMMMSLRGKIYPGSSKFTPTAKAYQLESYPIQDEPEGEMGFQYKMSLERMAC